jgi:type IV secretion system protein TrbL
MWNLSIVAMILYAFIALQVALAMIEFYLMTSIALVFMPFGALKWTKFMFDKGLHLIINSALKLMMITFLVFLTGPLLNIALPTDPSYTDMFKLMTMLAAIIWLMWKLPHMVTQVASSQPVSANDIASSIGRGVKKGINKIIELKTGGTSKIADAGLKVEKSIENVRSVAPPPISSDSSQDKSPLEK